MLKIWGRKTSINVQKVMWTVAELDLAHERIDAGGPFGRLDTPEFAALNPFRCIPVIEDGDFVLWESNAIVRYLAATYDQGGLAPADPKALATADQWAEWSAATIYPDLIPTIFLSLIRVPAAERDHGAVEAAVKRVGEAYQVLDGLMAGRSFIVGDTLTIADIGVGSLLYRYFTLDIARPDLPNLKAYYERLAERPAYREHVMVPYDDMRVPGA